MFCKRRVKLDNALCFDSPPRATVSGMRPDRSLAAKRFGSRGGVMPARVSTLRTGSGTFGVVLNGEPARRMTLVFATNAIETVRRCFDLQRPDDDSVKFPVPLDGFIVRIFTKDGKEIPAA